jgi:hypothetical protein
VCAAGTVVAAVILSPGSAFRSRDGGDGRGDSRSETAVTTDPATPVSEAETAARGRHVVVYDPANFPVPEDWYATPQERAVGFTDFVTQLAEYDAWVINGGDEASFRFVDLGHPCVVVMATGRVHAAIERLCHMTPSGGRGIDMEWRDPI